MYHFTHVDNLPKIIASGAMSCDRILKNSDVTCHEIAYSYLKERRMRTRVEVAPGGTLGDYVPFYFAPCSPMLLTYIDGNVTGQQEYQDEIIYLVSNAEYISERGLRFVFTDGHPITEPKAFYNDLADIGEVDFSIMSGRLWYNTNDDPDRKRRRQAEFLVHESFPWDCIRGIGVLTNATQELVEHAMDQGSHKPPCVIRPGWYYPNKGKRR
ncbi:MAG TPA: DUF4433 domain-containing protein [Streptosporangiaceae bacterium]|nr:DUF4433 domain-containing protein [Streptosporangiaceae bacterium]